MQVQPDWSDAGRPRLPPSGPRQKTPPLSEKFRKQTPPFQKILGRGPLPNFQENETPPTDGLVVCKAKTPRPE